MLDSAAVPDQEQIMLQCWQCCFVSRDSGMIVGNCVADQNGRCCVVFCPILNNP